LAIKAQVFVETSYRGWYNPLKHESEEVIVDYEDFLALIKNTRSIRGFRPEPIPDEYVDKIIEAGRWAPSAGNSQPWEFIVVKKQELKDSIVQIIMEQNVFSAKMELTREPEQRFYGQAGPPERLHYRDAAAFIIVCGDPRAKDAYPLNIVLQRGESMFLSSLANAFLFMHMAATALGLGSQWVSSTGNPFAQSLIKDLLGIPRELVLYDMLAVGYPAQEPTPRFMRAKEELVHYDHYDKSKFRTDDEVRDFLRRSKAWLAARHRQ
jgi:nitroreductase